MRPVIITGFGICITLSHRRSRVCALQHSGYHPQTSVAEVKHRPLRMVLGWETKMVEYRVFLICNIP